MIHHQTKLRIVYIIHEFVNASDEFKTLHFDCDILRFMLIESMRDVQNRMLFLVFQRNLMKTFDDIMSIYIYIQNEFSFEIRMNEYKTWYENLLKQLKDFMNLWNVRKLLFIMNVSLSFQIMMWEFIKLLFKIIIERNDYSCEMFDKDLIIIEHVENLLNFFYYFKKWYDENCFDFFSLHWEIEA